MNRRRRWRSVFWSGAAKRVRNRAARALIRRLICGAPLTLAEWARAEDLLLSPNSPQGNLLFNGARR